MIETNGYLQWCPGGSLVCCESCPASYHTECCEEKPPAQGKWNCELCTDGKRPMYGEIVWCKAGVYRWTTASFCVPIFIHRMIFVVMFICCCDCNNTWNPVNDFLNVNEQFDRWWPGEVCHPRNIPTNIQNLPHGIGEFPVYFFGSNDYLWTHRGRWEIILWIHQELQRNHGFISLIYAWMVSKSLLYA